MSDSKKKNAPEARINRLYEKFHPLADRCGYTFRRPVVSIDGIPNVLLLGNHSSGKSSFINHLLEGAPVQDTGVAPTDDGFTVVLFGEEESDVAGPAALDRLPPEFATLRSLGPSFLQHLRVKFRNRPILQKVSFIDSPGMIGSSDSARGRGYDFLGAVRRLSEVADLVLFLFDPDKPGTTGETVGALGTCFRGLEFKLRILMNKCDLFDGMYDFARAYGALCWNLAHVLPVKDLPTVFTTFVPQRQGAREEARIGLQDFDRHRGDIVEQIVRAKERRTDNLAAMIGGDFAALSMQATILLRLRRAFAAMRTATVAATAAAAALGGAGGWYLARRLLHSAGMTWWHWRPLCADAAGLVVAAAAALAILSLARYAISRRRNRFLKNPDTVFESAFLDELAAGGRDDLRQTWEEVRDDVVRQFRTHDTAVQPFDGLRIRRLEKARAGLAGLFG